MFTVPLSSFWGGFVEWCWSCDCLWGEHLLGSALCVNGLCKLLAAKGEQGEWVSGWFIGSYVFRFCLLAILRAELFRILSDFPDAVGDYGKCEYREHWCDEDNQWVRNHKYMFIMVWAMSLWPCAFGCMPSAQYSDVRSPLKVSNGVVMSIICVRVWFAIWNSALL